MWNHLKLHMVKLEFIYSQMQMMQNTQNCCFLHDLYNLFSLVRAIENEAARDSYMHVLVGGPEFILHEHWTLNNV